MKKNKKHLLPRSGAALLGLLATTATCKDEEQQMMMPPATSTATLKVQSVNTRTNVAEQMWGAIEMQLSGEPLAETMGRNLDGYDRQALLTDQYAPPDEDGKTDTVGYSTAVESYEYSKLAMNMLSFESGAGLSLQYGPLVNPTSLGGTAAVNLLRDRVQALSIASSAGIKDAMGPWVMVPAPTDNVLNRLGFAGLVPQFAELSSFDSDIAPSGDVMRGCSLEGGYGASAGMKVLVGDYECGYNTLHLSARPTGTKQIHIDAIGLAAWKQALWVINYFQFVHDVDGRGMTHVPDAGLAMVGKPGNTVKADDNDGMDPGAEGTYIGSSDLEGFQGLLMLEELDNKAAWLLGKVTSNGTTLSALTTKQALDYDWMSTISYFPHAISVDEDAGADGAEPKPARPGIATKQSQLSDLLALIGAYAEVFALTDLNNPDVGGSSTVRPVLDGDPFPLDNGMPDGEATTHDRALAVLKLAIVNIDRMHADPTTGALVDSAELSGTTVARGTHVSTVEVARSLVALRTAYRALTSQLTLYSNSTPDRASTTTALDASPMKGIPGGVTLAARLQQLIKAQADFLSKKLVAADGLAVSGWSLAGDKADDTGATLEAQAAAIRGLLEAYLATSNTDYRARAQAAYTVLEQRYYHKDLRLYRPTPSEENTFKFSPLRFGLLQGALRDMYTQVGSRPGQETLAAELEERIGRLNKVVLNGWDDANKDGKVDYPGECIRVEATLPRGGLQMAERALTGELGIEAGANTSDRDKDCVPEIDDAKLPASLAAELVLVRK